MGWDGMFLVDGWTACGKRHRPSSAGVVLKQPTRDLNPLATPTKPTCDGLGDGESPGPQRLGSRALTTEWNSAL